MGIIMRSSLVFTVGIVLLGLLTRPQGGEVTTRSVNATQDPTSSQTLVIDRTRSPQGAALFRELQSHLITISLPLNCTITVEEGRTKPGRTSEITLLCNRKIVGKVEIKHGFTASIPEYTQKLLYQLSNYSRRVSNSRFEELQGNGIIHGGI